ncbi:formyl-CoA transferase [Pueribacillus theae]|uniref:Formyl-CoA transferase n=1 Tax=Pueribacillus theae TaxID=2171751 RepID=A0A2U1JSB5_9BACI|nr:CoA transferase [Pueribacillus theae]PWA07708.1 formyl-CoA transferase [Pueribacillus theae]
MGTSEMLDSGFGPLNGLKVLDIGTLIAGPFGAGLLADFGATVIKVELPGVGDSIRSYGKATPSGSSLAWSDGARNKHTITLDMRQEDGQKLIKRLVEWADILIENFSPGTLEKWNLGYEHLSEINPRLIMVRVSGFGQTGPYKNKPGLDRIALGFSGLNYITGQPDHIPVKMGISVADYMTATFNALSALMAVYHRDVVGSGKGQVIDLALYEAPFRVTEDIVPIYGLYGEVRERIGNGHLSLAPAETFEAEDGRYVIIHAGLDNAFRRLAKAMGQAHLTEDPRFSTARERAKHSKKINGIVAEWVRSLPGEEVLLILEKASVPATFVNNIEDIFNDPHIAARENIIKVEDPELGEIHVPGVVPKFSRTPGKVAWAGKKLGQDNDKVFLELLELDKAEYERLKEQKII